jgi:hypothetical protein
MYAVMDVLSESNRTVGLTPDEFYSTIRPAFFGLIDLMMGQSIQGQLINILYGDVFRHLENMTIILVANDLLGAFINNGTLDGIITGASLSFHIFNAADSVIEGTVINPIASRNDVFLVGPNQVEAIRSLLEAFNPGEMEDLEDIWNFFEGIVDAIQGAGESYDEAYQPPDNVFMDFCILGGGSSCNVAVYGNGFGSVHTCSGFICLPAPVLVLVHNLDSGRWAWGLFDFLGTR